MSYILDLDAWANGIQRLKLDGFLEMLKQKSLARDLVRALWTASEQLVANIRASDVLSELLRIARDLARKREISAQKPRSADELIERAGGLDAFLSGKARESLSTPWPRLTYVTGGIGAHAPGTVRL